MAGFILSRLAAGEAEILSIAIAPKQRGRGLARPLLDLNLRRLAGLGARTVFLEVERIISRPVRCIAAPVSPTLAAEELLSERRGGAGVAPRSHERAANGD